MRTDAPAPLHPTWGCGQGSPQPQPVPSPGWFCWHGAGEQRGHRGGDPGTAPLSDGGTAAASGSPAAASAGVGPPAPQRAPCRDGHRGVPLGRLAPSRTGKNRGLRKSQHRGVQKVLGRIATVPRRLRDPSRILAVGPWLETSRTRREDLEKERLRIWDLFSFPAPPAAP